ncbi:hypothetical protein [Halobacillus massiliensis]|uniref:hypothetical protein n=1 Tax=Halobacillus massiliensis TaxID=1926286 RepID=UPI0009E58862|nr:hypothetical protein [Halobacillus massiliensis]
MLNYNKGQIIQYRCPKCFNNEAVVLKAEDKDFTEKTAGVLWVQCQECGFNDNVLLPAKDFA